MMFGWQNRNRHILLLFLTKTRPTKKLQLRWQVDTTKKMAVNALRQQQLKKQACNKSCNKNLSETLYKISVLKELI